ncbi:hypothetical protein MKK55_27330 [Methylobacterium sp. J-059]|uniref:hypothetical protein n=1 Tax=Methylobacterium sp. J-059 TaxID=2836643 RepID=UPI001FBB6D79|nr:hypothetical protein [Methylobacterium sp. J-059]MCJ2042631.1 hypothetical protein [Methylobacterium sp. J-059]
MARSKMRSVGRYSCCAILCCNVLATAVFSSQGIASEQIGIENRCWTKSRFRPLENWPVSSSTYCFRANGEVDGFWFDAGDGGDLTAHWKKRRRRLVIRDFVFAKGLRNEACDFRMVEASQTLVMDHCAYGGDWLYNSGMTESVFKEARP